MREKERYEAVIAEIREAAKTADDLGRGLTARLTSNENARLLWASVCRNIKPENLRSPIVKKSPELAYFTMLEVYTRRLERIVFKTPSAHKKELSEIATQARLLIRSLVSSESRDEPWQTIFGPIPSYGSEMLGDNNLLLNLIIGAEHGSNDSFDASWLCSKAWDAKQAEEYRAHDEILQGSSYEDMTPEQESAMEKYRPARDKDWLLSMLGGSSLVSVLTKLEKLAMETANMDLIVKRSKDRRAAEIKWLCTNLLPLHTEFFGRPLWDTLALAITLCLDLEKSLTADDIRPLLKDQKGGN